MAARSWGTSGDGSIEYFSYDPRYHHDGVFDALEKAFYPHEQVCKAMDISSDPQAVKELNELIQLSLKDGVSLVAVDTLTGKVVGAVINKIQVKAVEEEPFYEKFTKTCKSAKSVEVMKFMAEADEACNLFEYCKVDCLLELTFLVVAPGYRNKKIGEYLIKNSIEIAKKLLEGENVKVPIDDCKLSLDPRPKLVTALFSSRISQKIGTKCGFEIAATIFYKDQYSSGKVWAGNIEDEHPSSVLVYKLL